MIDFSHPIETLRISPGRLDVEAVAGDTVRFAAEIVQVDKDDNGTPVDVSGATFKGEVIKGGTDQQISTIKWWFVTDGTDGKVEFQTNTVLTEPGSYHYDIEMTEGTGGTRTILAGSLFIHKQAAK